MIQIETPNHNLYLFIHEYFDDLTIQEALSESEAASWREVMDSEYQSLIENGTWYLVPPSDKYTQSYVCTGFEQKCIDIYFTYEFTGSG
jgi:hypothetical protein